MRKVAFLLVFILLVHCLPTLAISASSAVVIDATNNRVLYEHNAYEKRSMASTTKIMTALCALEKGNMDDVVTVSAHAAGVEGSSIWLETGEKITLKSLIVGLMLSSGNDAASAIAEHISGSEAAFAEIMTKKAHEIGANNTQFKNPHGLDAEGHYTTAYDLAIITSYALKNPLFAEIVSTSKATIEWEGRPWGRTLNNHNKLLNVYEGCDGVKTGYTKKTGRCLVTSATRDGQQLVAVTLNDPDDWNDHKALLDRCFSEYEVAQLCAEEEHLATLPVLSGTTEYLPLKATSDVAVRLSVEECEAMEVVYDLVDAKEAPISFGEVLGQVSWHLEGKELATVQLVASEHVNRLEEPHPLFESFFKISRKWLNLPEKNDIINLLNTEEETDETSEIFG